MNSIKIHILVVLVLNICITSFAAPCPKKCSCHSSWIRGIASVVVDCSKRGLTSIPTRGVSRRVTSL